MPYLIHTFYVHIIYSQTPVHQRYIYIYGVASKFGYGSARGDPDVWIGLDHLRFGMDRGYGSACGFRVWIGALHFDSQPCAMCVRLTSKYDTDQYNTNMFHRFRTDCFNIVLVCFSFL